MHLDCQKNRPQLTPSTLRQRGSSLIEVLIAVVIMSFGVLALAGMQAFAISANQNVLAQGLAANMAADIADMVRANPAAFANGNYDLAAAFDGSTNVTAVPALSICAYPNCTTTTIATFEVAMVKARLKANLRGGTYALVRPSGSLTVGDLWVMWTERRNSGSAANESNFDKCPAAVVSTTSMPRCFYMRISI